jgi:hypothetical protein
VQKNSPFPLCRFQYILKIIAIGSFSILLILINVDSIHSVVPRLVFTRNDAIQVGSVDYGDVLGNWPMDYKDGGVITGCLKRFSLPRKQMTTRNNFPSLMRVSIRGNPTLGKWWCSGCGLNNADEDDTCVHCGEGVRP